MHNPLLGLLLSNMFNAHIQHDKKPPLTIAKSKIEEEKYWSSSPDFIGTLEEIKEFAIKNGYDGIKFLGETP